MVDIDRAVLQGDRRALARVITLVENDTPQGKEVLDALFPHTGNAHIIGVTMASRGALGGLAHNTQAVSLILDAAGYDFIVIETVGAGQSEVEIASLAHSVLVVEAPGLGDDIQAAKAGILEIADILVLNKADRSGVDAAEMALKAMLSMGYPTAGREGHIWVPPIQRTIAIEAEGIPQLIDAIFAHANFLKKSTGWQQRDQAHLQTFVRGLLQRKLQLEWQQILDKQEYQDVFEKVFMRDLAPYAAVARIQP